MRAALYHIGLDRLSKIYDSKHRPEITKYSVHVFILGNFGNSNNSEINFSLEKFDFEEPRRGPLLGHPRFGSKDATLTRRKLNSWITSRVFFEKELHPGQLRRSEAGTQIRVPASAPRSRVSLEEYSTCDPRIEFSSSKSCIFGAQSGMAHQGSQPRLLKINFTLGRSAMSSNMGSPRLPRMKTCTEGLVISGRY